MLYFFIVDKINLLWFLLGQFSGIEIWLKLMEGEEVSVCLIYKSYVRLEWLYEEWICIEWECERKGSEFIFLELDDKLNVMNILIKDENGGIVNGCNIIVDCCDQNIVVFELK